LTSFAPRVRRPKRASVLQWNPEVATQLFVGSDDDSSPALQLWDLRNSVSPLKELKGHTAVRAFHLP
jgi:protein transport protein SEC31